MMLYRAAKQEIDMPRTDCRRLVGASGYLATLWLLCLAIARAELVLSHVSQDYGRYALDRADQRIERGCV